MSLYLKYRPATLLDVKGNQEIIAALDSMLNDIPTCPHSFLLAGPTGCGKTTLGRIIAQRLGCIGSNFREVDSADFRGIDTVREMRKNSAYKPSEGSTCRVWLIDECHKMTNDAQNALLKILEDTPSHVYFILCTTEPNKLLPTIKGRCSTFQVKQLSEIQMINLLRKIAKLEGQQLEKIIYEQIAQDSMGHPRNAIQVLEQVLRVPQEQQLATAQRVAEQQSQMIELCRALIGKKPWKEVSTILSGLKEEQPESIRRMILGYCVSILLKGNNQMAGAVMETFMENTYDNGFNQIVFACYSLYAPESQN